MGFNKWINGIVRRNEKRRGGAEQLNPPDPPGGMNRHARRAAQKARRTGFAGNKKPGGFTAGQIRG
jgi:hypothetical protein